MAPSRRILRALAQQIDQKEQDIQLAKSLGKSPSDIRAWEFQAKEWQKVLDEGTTQLQEEEGTK